MGCLHSKAVTEKKSPIAAGHDRRAPASGKKAADKYKTQETNGTTPATQNGHAAESKKEETRPGEKDAAKASTDAASEFLYSILEGTEKFIGGLPDSTTVKEVVMLTFTNSCAEVTRTKFRLRLETITDLISEIARKQKLPLLGGAVAQVEERAMDDGFSRILLAWFSNNPSCAKKIPIAAGQAVLDTLYIRYVVNKAVSFEDILAYQLRWITVNEAASELFSKFTDGKDLMTAEQLGKFMRETQLIDVADRQVNEKFKYRFGGGIHRYNFGSYNGSVLTNNAIDPSRTSNVWQDMTQSFTHYMVSCARIETAEDLRRVAVDGTRALVLNLKRAADKKLMAGACEFADILENVKKNGFTTNTYPIVLCLSPGEPMPLDVQDEVAQQITDTLGLMVAEGLMFEGAMINDPKFSPGALRKKVLIMSYQSRLKPFIGFLVADMNKDGLGVRVTDVMEGTPAAKGGVLKDDWLTHINGDGIRNKQHLRERLAKLKVGDEFSVRRENLDELKVVVGGAIDSQDTTASAALSSITFFKYAEGPDPKPWDTQRVLVSDLATVTLTRKDLNSHFALCSIDSAHLPKDMQDPEGVAAKLGIEFVDTDNSERCLCWARGRFCDNGRCGYILKSDVDSGKSPEMTLNIIAGPRLLNCVPASSVKTMVHGAGTARVSGSQVTFSNCDQATIVVLTTTYEINGAVRTFISSFCPALLRPGYRALPTVPGGEARTAKPQIHGVYCFIK